MNQKRHPSWSVLFIHQTIFFNVKSKLFILFFSGFATLLFAQNEKILPVAQEMPTLEACARISDHSERRNCTDETIDALLEEHLEYPEAARMAGVEGFVIVRVVIDEKGKAVEYTVDEDPGYGMGEAAIKAIKKFGKWVPARNMGKAVKVRLTIPVKFAMPDQPEENKVVSVPDVYEMAEKMPRFQGCDVADETEARICTHQQVAQYMRTQLVYPEEAKKQKVSGTVIVSFVVDEIGAVQDAKVERGIGSGCDEEALRIVQSMPQWIPGMQGGKAVKVRQNIPFQFLPTEKE